MRKSILMLCLSTIALAFVACDDNSDATAMPNIYEGFIVAPEKPTPGDSITITAKVQTPGRHQYGTIYSWKITVPVVDSEGNVTDSIQSFTTPRISDGSQYRDASWRVKIPENAEVTFTPNVVVSFSNKSGNSADGATSGTFSGKQGPGCIGNITSTISTLYSSASGSCRFRLWK